VTSASIGLLVLIGSRYRVCAAVGAMLVAQSAAAHESGFSTLHLRIDDTRVTGDWELTWHDARVLLGEDAEGALGATPLPPSAVADLEAVLGERLGLEADGRVCPFESIAAAGERSIERESVRLRLEAACADSIASLSIRYAIFFELDPSHRGYFSVEDAGGFQAGVFTRERPEVTLAVRRLDRVRTFLGYAAEGVRHLGSGLDHVLFLVALLLPCVLTLPGAPGASGTAPAPRASLRAVSLQVVGIVTAFTLAHSVTLSLAVLGALGLPARPVEALIAGSVFVVAWNNVRPFLPGRGAWMAFGFGLVHGLGFAGALAQPGLPRQARGLALLGFNLGVEAGQLAIVLALLPPIYALRNRQAYRTWGMTRWSRPAARCSRWRCSAGCRRR
jgi:hypothetical protein